MTAEQGTEKETTGKTFTQEELDKIIESRLAADRARQPNDDELRAYREWKKTQKSETERQAERDAEYKSAKEELAQLKIEREVTKAQCKAEFTEFVATKIRGMDGDFAKNLETFKEENPQYFGESVVKKTSTGIVTGGVPKVTTNQIMNDLIRGKL